MFVPEGNFKFLVMWKQIGPLCTGECEKLACIAEILMTLGVLRWPARFFVFKRCSFDVTGSEKTLLVTLYWRKSWLRDFVESALDSKRWGWFTCIHFGRSRCSGWFDCGGGLWTRLGRSFCRRWNRRCCSDVSVPEVEVRHSVNPVVATTSPRTTPGGWPWRPTRRSGAGTRWAGRWASVDIGPIKFRGPH